MRQHVAAGIAEDGWQYPDYSEDPNTADPYGDAEDNGSDGFESGNGVYNQ